MSKSSLTVKGAAHIRTMRQIKSFRSAGTSTGVFAAPLDRGRIAFEYQRLARQQRYRRGFSQPGNRWCRALGQWPV